MELIRSFVRVLFNTLGFFCLDINDCASSPCMNNGVCHDGLNSFSCSCQSGYSGVTCQTDINECESNPCMNNGICSDGIGSFTCSCQDGTSGINCQFQSGGSKSSVVAIATAVPIAVVSLLGVGLVYYCYCRTKKTTGTTGTTGTNGETGTDIAAVPLKSV